MTKLNFISPITSINNYMLFFCHKDTNIISPRKTIPHDAGEMGESGQKVKLSSYKLNKTCRCSIQHGDYS